MIYVIAVILFFILIIVFYHFVVKKNDNIDQDYKIKQLEKASLVVKDKFMFQIELKILSAINEGAAPDFIAFPKVNLGSILAPNGSKVAYNSLADKVVDFVIFEKQTMRPVLIVDAFDNSFADESLAEQDPQLSQLLNDLKLTVFQVYIKGNFDAKSFASQIKDKLYPVVDKQQEKK